jgi:outer membrane protein TolC
MVVFRQKTACILVMAGILLSPTLSLQAQQSGFSSLPDLVNAATQHLPVLLQKKALVNSAMAGVTDARHSFLPSLTAMDELNVASSNSLPGAYTSFGIIPSVSSSVRSSNNYQAATGDIAILYSEYELVNFGLRKARVQNAQAVVGIEQADLDEQTYLVKAQISKLYFDLLRTKYQLGVEQQNILRYRSVDSVINALTSSGIQAGVDSSLAKAELSKARVTYNQRLGTLGQLTQQMAYLTGLPAGSIRIDTAGRQHMPPDQGLINKNNPADSTANPLINYYQKQKQYYQSSETLVKKSYLPKVLLTGGAWGRGSSIDYTDTYKSLATGVGYQRFNYMVGLTFAYDLFDPVHRKDKLSESRFQTQASDFQLQQQALSLSADEAKAMEAIREAESNLREIPIQMQAATDAYDQKVAQYKAGIINLVDLTEASYVLYSAQISYVETLNDWFLASLDKATATGTLDQFIQLIK